MNITTKLFSAAVAAACCFGLVWTGDCIAAGQPVKEPAVKGTRLSWVETSPFLPTAINSEILPESRGRIEVRFAYYGNSVGGYGCIFDARKGGGVLSYSLFASPLDGNTWTISYFHYNDKMNAVPPSQRYNVGEPVVVSISADEGIAVNGETMPGTAVGAADFTVGGKLRLFSSGSPGSESDSYNNGAIMKFYWMKVYRADNSLQASFVPYRAENGVVGVLEECEGRFHEVSSGKLYCGRVLTAEPIKRGRAHVCVSGISVLDPSDKDADILRRYLEENDLCLWTACDSTDKGENLADWQYRRFCGYIPFEGWEGEVMPPDEFLQSDFNGVARVFIAGAPYGLVGDGNSYLELDDGIGSSNRVEILFKSAQKQQSGVFGARIGPSDHNFSMLLADEALCVDFTLNNYNETRCGAAGAANAFCYVCSDWSVRSGEAVGKSGIATTVFRSENTSKYTTIFQPAANCRVFGMYGAPAGYGCFKGAIYSFKVFNTESGELSYDLVPAVNEQEEPCMYDLVSGKFYENKGTGSFQILDANTTTSYSIPLKRPNGLAIFFQ